MNGTTERIEFQEPEEMSFKINKNENALIQA